MVVKSTNSKLLSTSKPEISSKPLSSTIQSSKSSKRKDSSMSNNSLSNFKGKSRICKKNSRPHKTLREYHFLIIQDLSLENKKLNDILISNKLNFEEEIRDLKNRSRD